MPAGNPAGYLPQIKKAMKKAGIKRYKVRKKQPKATIKVPQPPRAAQKLPPNQNAGAGSTKAPPVPQKKVVNTAGPGSPGFMKRPKQYDTTKGKRRLSAKEAIARRTTESSKRRAAGLYNIDYDALPKPTPLPKVTGGSTKAGTRYKKKARKLKLGARYLGRNK